MVTNNDDPRIVRADSMRASERGGKEGGETGRRLAAASEQSAPPPGNCGERGPQAAMAAKAASLLAPRKRRWRKKPGLESPARLRVQRRDPVEPLLTFLGVQLLLSTWVLLPVLIILNSR